MDNMNICTDKRANPKTNRTSICKLLLFAAALQMPAGCVNDELYNIPHPDEGTEAEAVAVAVTTDWSGRSSDAVLPDSYVLRIGDKEQTVSGETNAFSTLFLPGKQDLLVWHTAEGTTVDGTTATINTLPDGTLEPMPGYLFSAAHELNIVKDDTLRLTVPMKQYIRRLVLVLKLNPGDEQRIGSTAARLTGIASATNLSTGELVGSEGKTVVPAFALTTDADAPESRATGKPVLSATLHLMGVITGERQMLTLEITLPGGDVHTLSTDLTDMLKNFRTDDDKEPLMLNTSLELPTEAGKGASITGWEVVDNGEIKVN